MNPVTFNNSFKELLAAPQVRGHIQRDRWPRVEQILSAPLFGADWSKIKEVATEHSRDERTWRARNEVVFNEDQTCRLPFPQMRAEIKGSETYQGSTLDFTLKLCLFNAHNEHGHPVTWAISKMETDEFANRPPYVLMWIRKVPEGSGRVEDVDTDITLLDSRRGFAALHSEHETKVIIGSRVVSAVGLMLYDILSPANHIAKVRPDAPGKSAEWIAAREHYVVLDRRHEANKKEIAEGARVAQDEGKNHARLSHSRRAHWRTYKHERYVAAKGRRTWIKSIWVGPKVWRDMAGSIYQIVQ